ncbi:MAG: tetratricopeptide repeat protein [candidate division WOR-3 bacterium]
MFRRSFVFVSIGAVIAGCVAGNPHASSVKIYIQQRDNAKAMSEAQAWAESEPTSAKPYLWMGVIKASEEDYNAAADFFMKAFAMDSSTRNPDVINRELTIAGASVFDAGGVYQVILNAGINFLNEGDAKSALKYFEEAKDLRPSEAKAYLLLVSAYEQMNDTASARKALVEADRLDPKNPQVKLHLALFAEQDGKLDEAEKLVLEALKLDTAYAEAYKELGFINFERGKKIEDKYNESKDPKEKEALKPQILKHYTVAAENFAKATKLDETLGEAWLNLGICYIKIEKSAEAAAALEKYTSMKPNDYNGWFLLAGAYLPSDQKSDQEKALVAIDMAISIKETPEAYNLKGAILKNLNRKKESMDAFKKALELEGKQK